MICDQPLPTAPVPGNHGEYYYVGCVKCGEYLVEHRLTYAGNTLLSNPKLCALINKYRAIKGRDVFLHTRDFDADILRLNESKWDAVEIEEILDEWPSDVPERLELAFFLFANHYNIMGEQFSVESNLSIAWGLLKESECNFALSSWISLGYVKGNSDLMYILPKGWEYLEEIKQKSVVDKKLKQVFVAMSFSTEHEPIYELAIKPAIEACGYTPMIIRDKHYNDGVMDNIIAEIRKSRFVIADYTGNKRGVYYEAGFAFGLGLEVVKCVDEAQLSPTVPADLALHFDVKHINFIAWKDHATLKTRLVSRIKAMNL